MVSQIRPATADDIGAIQALCAEMDALHVASLPDRFRACGDAMHPLSFWQEALARPLNALLVAESETSEVVGYALLCVHDTPDVPNVVPQRLALLDHLAVHPTYRRAGYGSRLLEQAELEAKRLGARSVELRVWDFNVGALSLYEIHGYTGMMRRLIKRF